MTHYKWLLNLDTTGEPNQADPHPAPGQTYGDNSLCHPSTNPSYPSGCYWPSIHYAIASPAISEGTDLDWNSTTPLPVGGTLGKDRGLPNNCPTVLPTSTGPVANAHSCKYLVTVTADGYQIGGAHFTVPSTSGIIPVYLNPFPIPLGTVRLKVFKDVGPTDGTYDENTEPGMAGFYGILNDVDGIVQSDYFGNPLCTQYLNYQNTNASAPGYTTDASLVGKIVLSPQGQPTPLPAKDPAPPDPQTGYYNPTVPGKCLSDSNGDIVIPNMAPNHYSASVTPPIGDTTHWIQTTTLEGNHDFDVWVQPNDTGFDTEVVVGGEPVPFVQFGFVPETAPPSTWSCPAGGTPGTTPGCGQIRGQLFQANTYVPGIGALPGVGGANGTSGVKLQNPIDRGWVALNSLNASSGDYDKMVANIPTQDPSRVGLQYPDCPPAPTLANPSTAGQGCFEFTNVPDGEYLATIWDEPQDTALDRFNVTISNGQVVDMGVLPLLGWFSHIYGHVFIDTNGNGRMDPGEKGLFHMTVQNLNRTNNAMVGGINTSDTDNNGLYDFKEAYPLGLMSINQFFNTRFKTTGVTWQSCNDPQEHTTVAPMVDVSYAPIIGQCGRLDWGVQPYHPSTNGDNGGIVATMIYDEIRQKYNARQAQTNDYQTGIPGFTFEQYTPVKGIGPGGTDNLSGYALNSNGSFCTVQGAKTNPAFPNCGDYTSPALSYISENNGPPAQCYPQDANGNPIGYVAGNPNSYDFMVSGGACIETSAAGTQFGLGTDASSVPNPFNPNPFSPDPLVANHPVQTVDGNYTLGNLSTIPAQNLGDVLVHPRVPVDTVLPPDPATGLDRPLYTYTTEQDVNSFSSAQYVPQGGDNSAVTWPPVAGPAKQMPNDLSKPDGGYDENPYTTAPGPDPICSGATYAVHVTNGALLANGGSPFEGTIRHSCDTKLLSVQAGQSIAPNFHVHTLVDIPLPAHFWGYIVDDVSVETNRKSYNLGEVHGIPHVPVGVYDWTGRRVDSVNSDYNGVWEVLMPSADIFNCPTPAQTCPNVYRFVGNDPGQPAHPNVNYDPNYRTISANFEAWPNMLIPADTAPTRIATGLEGPGVQFSSTSPCAVKAPEPQLFAVGPAPYISAASGQVTLQGANFGTTTGKVIWTPEQGALGGLLSYDLPVVSWSDHSITVRAGRGVSVTIDGSPIPLGVPMPQGAGSLKVNTAATATQPVVSTTNGVTFHVMGPNYNPHVVEVGPGKQFDPFVANPSIGNTDPAYVVQNALDYAATGWRNYWSNHAHDANDPNNRWLVVVYPKWDPTGNLNTNFVPLGTYFENVIIHSPLKLQGIGPGGAYPDGTVVQGSLLDGRFWSTITPGQFDQPGAPGTEPPPEQVLPTPSEPNILHWVNLLASLTTSGTGFTAGVPFSGGQDPGEGAVVTVLGTAGTYPTNYSAAVDGFTISGGDLSDFPGNLNEVNGARTSPFPEGGNTDESAGALSVQGGAVFVNGGTDSYRLTNNLIKQNSGAYGVVRFGTEFQVDSAVTGGPSHNYGAVVSRNMFVANGGTSLAGAVGIFDDTNNYSVDHNTFCMNVSAEYGGAVSHFGYSPGGKIEYNRMFLNTAYDEGGAITIASEPAFTVNTGNAIPDPKGTTYGTGAVSVTHNYIGDNLAQDDGGGMRVMGTSGTKGLAPITINDNMITNNVSAHEGGAMSLADAPVVDIVNNTIAHNVTTATATSSDGQPASAGIAVDTNSAGLNTLLAKQYATQIPSWMNRTTWPTFSNARIQNDVLWYNRAGSWAGSGVAGIGMPGDTTAINYWDVGSLDAGALLTVSHSLIGSSPTAPGQQYNDDGTNRIGAPPTTGLCSNTPTDPNACASGAYNLPAFVNPYATALSIVQQRTYFRFRPSAIISVDLPANLFDRSTYRIGNGSPAQNLGSNNRPPVPLTDIENRVRPFPPNPVDAGAYQTGNALVLPLGGPLP